MVSRERIAEFGRMIADRFDPEKIILFGSHAYGNPGGDSDVDLLVVMPFDGSSHHKAVEIKSALPRPFPLDLLVRTPEELSKRVAMNDFFVKEIFERGIVLYERGN